MVAKCVSTHPLAGANRRWRWPFRCRGSRRESAVAQLFSLGSAAMLSSIHRGGLRRRAFGFFVSVPKAAHIVQAEAGFGFAGFTRRAAGADEPFIIYD